MEICPKQHAIRLSKQKKGNGSFALHVLQVASLADDEEIQEVAEPELPEELPGSEEGEGEEQGGIAQRAKQRAKVLSIDSVLID